MYSRQRGLPQFVKCGSILEAGLPIRAVRALLSAIKQGTYLPSGRGAHLCLSCLYILSRHAKSVEGLVTGSLEFYRWLRYSDSAQIPSLKRIIGPRSILRSVL